MTSAAPQTSVFLEKEGDAWFERNRSAYEARENHFEDLLVLNWRTSGKESATSWRSAAATGTRPTGSPASSTRGQRG